MHRQPASTELAFLSADFFLWVVSFSSFDIPLSGLNKFKFCRGWPIE
jgi:hypothetical protein